VLGGPISPNFVVWHDFPGELHKSLIFHVVESIIADNADVVGRLGAKVTHRTQVGDDVTHSWIILTPARQSLKGQERVPEIHRGDDEEPFVQSGPSGD
jgi:hypothetical protein